MLKFTVFVLLFLLSLPLQAQVYRCDGPGGPVYSQVPCAEDAERLAEYEPAEEASVQSSVEIGLEEPVEVVPEPPSAMENFVATLHKQREQQIGEMDRKIKRLEQNLEREGDAALDEEERARVVAELAELKSERASVSEQYTTLIAEAQRRAGSPQGAN